MKKLILPISLLLALWAGASVCEQEYHLQDAEQILLNGKSEAELQVSGTARKLNKSMNNVTLLHDSTEYRMITDWDAKGTCDSSVKREVKFAFRKKGEQTFSVQSSNEYSVKLNTSEFQFKKPGWDDYWFGFASSVVGNNITIYDAIGKFKSKPLMTMWYGNATMKRTLRDKSGKIFTHYYPELTSYPDSAALIKVLLNDWKSFVQSDTQNIDFSVQLMRLTYDSLLSPPTRLVPSKAQTGGFQARQTGNLVLIQVGEKKVSQGEPLTLYGMMGNKISTLHATGYMYQWNGKTSAGADASTGVYFVQSGKHILGKFFFTR